MILPIALSLTGPLLTAYLLISFLLPPRRPTECPWLLRISLSVGLAIGLASCSFFLWLVLFGPHGRTYVATETAGMLVLITVLLIAQRRRARPGIVVQEPNAARAGPAESALFRGFCGVLILAGAAFVLMTLAAPHGSWDGWAIWNMRARFLFRGGSHWADGFSDQLGWSHPDYPLLLPAAIARTWLYCGKETTVVPALVALLFTFGIVGVVLASVSVLRDRSQGLLAALTLVGTGYYVRHGAYQYADTPLSFFILATVALLCFHARTAPRQPGVLFLAGVMAGFAGWSKNEGLLFILSLLVTYAAVIVWEQGWRVCVRRVLWLLAGLAPVLGMIAYFKIALAPENDLFRGQGFGALAERFADPSRYMTIGKFFLRKLMSFGNGLPFVLVICSFVLGWNRSRQSWRVIVLPGVVLFTMMCGYFLVYVVTPHDLDWHLGTSAKRLMLHLFPLAIFTFFMVVASPRELERKA